MTNRFTWYKKESVGFGSMAARVLVALLISSVLLPVVAPERIQAQNNENVELISPSVGDLMYSQRIAFGGKFPPGLYTIIIAGPNDLQMERVVKPKNDGAELHIHQFDRGWAGWTGGSYKIIILNAGVVTHYGTFGITGPEPCPDCGGGHFRAH